MIPKTKRQTNPPPKPDLVKYVDFLSTPNQVSSTAVFSLLNAVDNGSDFYQRNNRIINARDVNIRMAFTQTGTVIGWYASDVARVIVFWDSQADATPTAADVLLDVTAAGATSTTNLSNKNINNKERFTILADEHYHLPAYSITTTNQINVVASGQTPNDNEWNPSFHIKLPSFRTRFNGAGTTITAINSGALYILTLGSIAVGSSGWAITTTARFSFSDS